MAFSAKAGAVHVYNVAEYCINSNLHYHLYQLQAFEIMLVSCLRHNNRPNAINFMCVHVYHLQLSFRDVYKKIIRIPNHRPTQLPAVALTELVS